MSALLARRALVRGRVQGVAFRHFTRERARELGLAGWVRNLPDGSVEVFLEGRAEALSAMLAWLHQGPPAARVESVELRDEPPTGCASFEVLR